MERTVLEVIETPSFYTTIYTTIHIPSFFLPACIISQKEIEISPYMLGPLLVTT